MYAPGQSSLVVLFWGVESPYVGIREENLIFKHLFLLKFSTYDVEHVYRYKYVTKQHADSRCTNISTHPHPISDCKNKRQKRKEKRKSFRRDSNPGGKVKKPALYHFTKGSCITKNFKTFTWHLILWDTWNAVIVEEWDNGPTDELVNLELTE